MPAIIEEYPSRARALVKGIMFLVAAAAVVLALLYVAERARRKAVARRRRRMAEERVHAALRETDERLARERRKREQATALTSVVPAIRDHGTRHVA